MEKYKLLRSNKESGPFAADELITMGFKAYDLIWVENKSAAWRYPSEIEEFKLYAPVVEEQPFDRFYKKKENNTAKSISTVVIPTQTVTLKKEKPRIKIKADCRKIEPVHTLPLITELNKNTGISTNEPSWESAWLNWEEEKKQATVLHTSKKAPEKSNGLVYGEDISNSSSDNSIYDFSPKKSSFSYKTIISTGVIVLALVGAGIWFGIKWTNSGNKKEDTPLTAQVETNATLNNAAATNTDAINEDGNSTSLAEAENSLKDQYPVPASLQNNSKPVNPKTTGLLQTKKDNTVLQQVNKAAQQDKTIAQEQITDKTIQQPASSLQAKNSSPTNENIFEAKRKKEPKINQYVQLHQDAQTPGAQYEIENTSDINIELVMVDLQYFDTGGKYLKGENMYVKNIGAGELAKIKSPVINAAQRVTAKISMISSAEKDLYLIAD